MFNRNVVKINCPFCNLEQNALLEPAFQTQFCDNENGGCSTAFSVEIQTAFLQETGKNVLRQAAIVRKIEGIEPITEEDKPLLVYYDFVVIQPYCDNEDYPATFQMIEKHELENERRKASETTAGNCGFRVVASFQAIVERKPASNQSEPTNQAFDFRNPKYFG